MWFSRSGPTQVGPDLPPSTRSNEGLPGTAFSFYYLYAILYDGNAEIEILSR